ncbi:MAG: hypothetical protein V3U75_07025 [Methylococcaceae bacterium]
MPNRDAIIYFQTANLFEMDGFAAANKLYGWPFYSIFIAYVHMFIGLSYENSAHLINSVLLLLFADAFIRFYWEWHPNHVYPWLPLVVFIVFPAINECRPWIIRDWGFWAFSMQSFYYLLKASRTHNLRDFLFWQVSIMLAFMFRIEAIGIICLAPLWYLFQSKGIISYLKANSIIILGSLFLVALISFPDSIRLIVGSSMGRLQEIATLVDLGQVLQHFKEKSDVLAANVLPSYSHQYSSQFMIGGIIGVILINTWLSLGYIFGGLWVFSWFRRDIFTTAKGHFLVLYLFVICLLLVLIYFVNTLIFAERYLVLASIILLVTITLRLEQFFMYCHQFQCARLRMVMVILLFAMLVAGILHTGKSKLYLQKMGLWTAQYLPSTARVIANEARLYYYSQRQAPFTSFVDGLVQSTDFINNKTEDYDYALLEIKSPDPAYDELIYSGQLVPIYSIASGFGTKAVLFRIKHQDQNL